MWKGAFIVKRLSAVSCTKTVKPIEMPFGMLCRVDPRNHVFDGGTGPPRKGQFCPDMPDDTLT